ncbi:UPF0183 protein, partial [Mucuna pruriens]
MTFNPNKHKTNNARRVRICLTAIKTYHIVSYGKKVGVGSLMNKAFAPPLPTRNIYMEEVQVKLREELYFVIGSQHIPFGASPRVK